MVASAQLTRAADWIKPSPFARDIGAYFKSRDGAKDSLEGVITVFEWMDYLGFHRDFAAEASQTLNPFKQGLAIPGFIEALGNMRDKWHILNYTDEPDAAVNFSTSVAVSTLNLCESAMCGDSFGVYSLKEGLNAAKTGFWASAGFLDTVSFFRELSKARFLQDKIEQSKNEKTKELLQHRVQLSYLNVIKATTTIAMAAISLVSLLFASLAQGILFSPVVLLTLGSAWLVLTYTTHFYSKMIDRWEAPPSLLRV